MSLLTELFRDKPATDYILIWTLDGHYSRWHNCPADISPLNFERDTYFGVGTSPERRGAYERCPADEISGIGGLWLDVDIAGPAHGKANLPATIDDALTLLEFLPLPPSYIIASGHGLQVYWLFESWWTITDENRAATKQLLIDFNTTWRSYCAAQGYDADSVCDLSRVMRLPGTKNHKIPSDVRDVTEMESHPERRYPIGELRTLIRPSAIPRSTTAKVEITGRIPADKWEALKAMDHRVERTFEMQREDLKDQSASGYEMSLARYAANAGWTDREISDLIHAFREHNGLDLKTHTRKYTIEKLRAEPEIKTLDQISAQLGISIARIVRYDSTPPAYIMTLEDNSTVHLGTIEGITSATKFRNTVAAETGSLPARFKAGPWDDLCRSLLAAVEHDSAGVEATEAGQCIEWIRAYLRASTVQHDQDDALLSNEPWTEEGETYIIGTALRGWIHFNLSDRIDSRHLGLVLRSIGAEPVQVARRNAWKLPKGHWTNE